MTLEAGSGLVLPFGQRPSRALLTRSQERKLYQEQVRQLNGQIEALSNAVMGVSLKIGRPIVATKAAKELVTADHRLLVYEDPGTGITYLSVVTTGDIHKEIQRRMDAAENPPPALDPEELKGTEDHVEEPPSA